MVKARAKAKPSKKIQTKTAVLAPRQLKKPAYKSFRLSQRIKGDRLRANVFKLFGSSVGVLARHWKTFLAVVLTYGILNALLVQGFNAAGNLNEAKATLDQVFTGNWAQLGSGLTVFMYLLGASGNTSNPTAGAYQLILVLVTSLALIWLLRQMYAGHKVRAREGFYLGMTPLVPFVLVLLVIVLQLIPMAAGLLLFSAVTANNIAASGLEAVLWAVFTFAMILLTLYMITSSLFALYIVTLPEMTPLRALRSARQLVANRRWSTLRKILFLPLALVLLAALVVVPVILFATPLAAWVFFVLTMLLLPVAHSYMYSLYRSLL